MRQNIKKIAFILIVSPVLVWILIHPAAIIKEWARLPSYFKNNIHSLIGSDTLAKVNEERWNSFGTNKENLLSKVYYNKGTVLVDDFFTMLTYLSPRIYFQAGDGTNFSPPGVEPIAIPIFVFWVLGFIALLKENKFKLILAVLFFGVFTYFVGQKTLAFLFPVVLIYLAISVIGIESIKSKKTKKTIYILLSLYGIYLLGRIFILK